MALPRLSRISYGGTAAIVTSMALIVGLDTAASAKSTVITALLIAALADNLTDSLSVHVYQESERLQEREAFIGTVSNFATRLIGCLTFVVLVALLPQRVIVTAAVAWGMTLLAVLTSLLARERKVGVISEVAKHLLAAAVVLALSRAVAALLV
jgi:hypothetical protein